MKRHRLLTFAALFLVLSCDDGRHPTGSIDGPRGPSKIIQDGAHGGNPNFFFLPPMVPHPDEPDGFAFNNRLQPALSVDICELASANLDPVTGRPTVATPCVNPQNPVKRFAPGSVQLVNSPRTQFGWWSFFRLPEDGFYYVLWNTKEARLDVSKYYRITVRLDGEPDALGIADVDPLRNLTQWQNSLTGEVIQLVDNMTLPIAFRVGQAALCEATESCTSATFSKTATTTQVLQLSGDGGGAIAAVSVPPGALPADGPQNVTFNIGRVNIGSTGLLSNVSRQEGGATVCHPALPLQQFEGCFRITTTPELELNENGEMFDLEITVAACFELHDTEDPREEFVQLWASDVDEPPHALPSADASLLLGADADDCGEDIVTVTSANGFMRVASAGLRKLQSGLSQFFGVKTAYAVDVGLGGLVKRLSNIGPAMTAEIKPHTNINLSLGAGATTTATARIVGTQTHSPNSVRSIGIGGVPVTFTLAPGHGELRQLGNIEGAGSSSVTVFTNRNPIDGSPTSGGGFAPVNWTMPAVPGTYTLTATGAALGGPVTYTATVSTPLANPVLALTDVDVILLAAGNLEIYKLAVTNYQVYPTAMFAPVPDLPPCNRRTLVEVWDANNNDVFISRLCGVDDPSDMQLLTVSAFQGTAPAQVYVKIVDLQTNVTYTSNTVSLTSPPAPDFAISSGTPTVSPAQITTSGAIVTMSPITIRNSGGSFSIAGGVRFATYLSTDATITSADQLVGSANIPAADLESGESFNLPFPTGNIPAGVAAGNYFLGLLIDDNNLVAESNEGNNYVSAPLVVTAPVGQVAFISSPLAGCCASDVYIQRLDGSERTRLTEQPTSGEFRPRWSPSGSVILFNRNGNLYTLNPETGVETLLASNADQGNYSPDGTKIVFTRGFRLWQMNASGGSQVQLSTSPMDQGLPSFAPDNATIVYMGQGAGQNIFRRDPSGTEIQLTTDNISTYPSFSPNGTKILFQSGKTIYSMNVDGTGQAPVREGSIVNGQSLWPTYAPDGTTIAFIRQQTNSHELYLMNSDGSGVRPVANTPDAIENYPSIRPNTQ